MKVFKDRAGREWTIDVNVSAVRRVRDLANVDLLKVLDGELLAEIVSNPITLANVLYALCRPQAEQLGVSDEQFGEGLAGDAIDAAVDALLGELVNFSRSRQRPALKRAIEKMAEVEQKAVELAVAKMDGPELAATLDRILNPPGGSSISAPESSA